MKNSILLVEDNPDDRILTIRALKQNNISSKIDEVKNGQEALDYLFAEGEYSYRDIRDLPRVVLLDLKLPKVNGLEVLQKVRANEYTKRLPVVMLTSSLEQDDMINCYDNGANSYVRKPVDFSEFAEMARQLGNYWLSLNEMPEVII